MRHVSPPWPRSVRRLPTAIPEKAQIGLTDELISTDLSGSADPRRGQRSRQAILFGVRWILERGRLADILLTMTPCGGGILRLDGRSSPARQSSDVTARSTSAARRFYTTRAAQPFASTRPGLSPGVEADASERAKRRRSCSHAFLPREVVFLLVPCGALRRESGARSTLSSNPKMNIPVRIVESDPTFLSN